MDTQSCKRIGRAGVTNNHCRDRYGGLFEEMGFTPQKPKKQAYEQCPKAVQKWLNEDYPLIKERAKKEKAEIYWGDETGVKNQCNHGRICSERKNAHKEKYV